MDDIDNADRMEFCFIYLFTILTVEAKTLNKLYLLLWIIIHLLTNNTTYLENSPPPSLKMSYFSSYHIDNIHYIVDVDQTASLVAAITSSGVQVLGHVGQDVLRAIRTGCSAELWDTLAIAMKGYAEWRKVFDDCCPGCTRRTGKTNSRYVYLGGSFRARRRLFTNFDS